MGLINQQVCDGCGAVVFGQNGVVQIKQSYVTVRGQVTVHQVDPQTHWVSHYHMTPTEMTDLSFCMEQDGIKLDCFAAYIEARTIIVKQKIEASKRRQATEESLGITHKDEGEYPDQEFVVGSPKPYNSFKKR